MFDLFQGIPVHALVVHGVVVLLPLAILSGIALSLRSTWREKYGSIVLGLAVVATLMVPIATQSGESLEVRVGDPGEHAELGDRLIYFALAYLLTLAILILGPRLRRLAGLGLKIVAGLVIATGIVCAVQVVLIGHSGAKAVWQDQVAE